MQTPPQEPKTGGQKTDKDRKVPSAKPGTVKTDDSKKNHELESPAIDEKESPTAPVPTQRPKGPRTPFLRNDPLVDFRQFNEPAAQRIRRPVPTTLPLFGYNYFEPARLAIEAYRLRFQYLLGAEYLVGKPNGTNGQAVARDGQAGPINDGRNGEPNPQSDSRQSLPPVTKADLEAFARLTQAQRTDLLTRARQNKLTEEEKARYGAAISLKLQPIVQTSTEPDPSDLLSDRQKLDLLMRQRDNQLTDEERTLYRKFLYGASSPVVPASQLGTISRPGINGGFTPGGLNNGGFNAGGFNSGGLNSAGQYVGGLSAFDLAALSSGNHIEAVPGGGTTNAFHSVAGPLEMIWRNVAATAPTNYQLAAGDRITYRFSTPTRNLSEQTLEVDSTGGVTVPEVGRVIVRGQTLAQAEAALQQRMVRFYKNAQISLSLKELRTMQVTVTGESFAPGTYMVPAVATAFNMLYATGGPTEDGSLRQIEVRRKGKVAGVIDFYKFFLTGDQTASDIQLEPGDVIYIPGSTGRVMVTGEVRRPAVFEISPAESLKDTLAFAGGLKASGVNQRVQVTTVQPGNARELKTVDVSQLQTAAKVPVFDGDVVEVFSVRAELTNVVSIDGAVDLPGQFAISPGMKIADLVTSARGLLSDAYPTLAHLHRWNPDNTIALVPINLEKAIAGDVKENVVIQRWDRLTVYSRQEVTWTGQRDVTIRGAVKNAGIYYRNDNMRVRDLLMKAGGTDPAAYLERAYLLHQRPDGSFAYDTIDLKRAIAEDPAHNALIEDHDILAVYRADEARFTPERTVSILGEANAPGKYVRGEQMKLSDLVGIAGGLTAKAGTRILIAHARRVEGEDALQATYSPVNGAVSPDPVLQDGDVVTIQGRSLIDTPSVITVSGAVNLPGPIILNGPKVRLSEVIGLAGGLKPEAFPEGVMFTRSADQLATAPQRQLMDALNRLNDILNDADYQRALALSDVEKYRAITAAAKSASSIAIPGLSSPESSNVSNLALGDLGKRLNARELVSQPRMLTMDDLAPKGNVAVNVEAAMRRPGSDDDILMVNGDSIQVPVRPTTVQVVGAVMESRGVLFKEGANLQHYLDHVGGFTRDAAKDKIQVIRLGGGLMPVQKVRKFLPGDVIMVPTQPMVAPIQNRSNTVDSIFRSLTNGALIVLVAKKLLGL
jgi:protein involved in polysaccharide export with SLBB domain